MELFDLAQTDFYKCMVFVSNNNNKKLFCVYNTTRLSVPLLVLGLRDLLRGRSQLLVFADETLRLLPHGVLRLLQPVLQLGDPPVQRGQVRVRLSDLHRRRGRHVPGRAAAAAARDAEDKSTGPVSSLIHENATLPG